MRSALDRFILKSSSGQWILTVTCAAVFFYGSIKGLISEQTQSAIISMVFVSYFKRDRGDGGKPSDPSKPDNT